MSELKQKIYPIKVTMICDTCGKGSMIPTGISHPVYPMRYEHRCNHCGKVDTFEKVYPVIDWSIDEVF